MAAQMWFGTLYDTNVPGSSSSSVNAKMQWVPCPDTGMGAGASGYSELMEFENGGAHVVDSAATHRVYEMDWSTRTSSGAGGLDVIRSYQQKIFGPGLIYFADPMNFTTNLFPPHWGTPALSQLGWKSIAKIVNYPTVPANGLNFPARAVTSDPGASVTKPTNPAMLATIPIPPGYTLYVCFRSAPGTGAGGNIAADAINLDGSYATQQVLQVNVPGTAVRYQFASSTYKAVEFWVRGSVSNLASSMAWLVPSTNAAPDMTNTPHIPGAGNTGCRFTSAAIVENYVMLDRTLKGMSTTLTEVGAWQRAGT